MAAKRVKGSVKCAEAAPHGCGRARGDEHGRRSRPSAARGTGWSPRSRGTAGTELGMGKWPEVGQGARPRKRSLQKRVLAPLAREAARLLGKEEIWTERVFNKSSRTIMRKIQCSNFLALVLVTILFRIHTVA